ncbi:MAG: VCBS repeat-containing protein [Bacteroidetes bacterium]|nr:VCBS repeat-containing protein [Bacteroidota bacterium]
MNKYLFLFGRGLCKKNSCSSRQFFYLLVCFFLIFLPSCKEEKKGNPLFKVLEPDKTGLNFSNTLHPDTILNLFRYMYFYNGSGIGTADFNNDGKQDLFFAANQGQNKIFLNEGNFHFKDITEEAKIPNDGGWSTGVSVVDINSDGLMDIYVCRVGKYKSLHGKNQLFICQGISKNGIPWYKDEAEKYGIDFSGFSTQAAFFDFDLDGDLDFFLMNHSVNHEGNYAPRSNFLNTYDSLAGDRMYRNDNGHFTDITRQSGINSSKIGYGLGLCISDINMDGWPDIYIGNDFHENDYLYINQHNGIFKEENNDQLMHTSQFSMGVDVADVNNDGFPEIISMDMLPEDPYILKRSLGEDDYDIFFHKISIGYNYQFARNNLQLNRRNGLFSEVGLYSGVYATDWSWGPLWVDFDNDGLKDLFISNGIPKRMNDIDYINFVSSQDVQEKLRENKMSEKEMELINRFPEIKIPNKFFSNKGDLKFTDIEGAIENNKPTFSNGSVYADLDNDGDLDIVVNNINDPALIYENKVNDKRDKPFSMISLNGPEGNINAIGAKIILFERGRIRTYENFSVRGFQSSMNEPLHVGLYNAAIDSAFLLWPDNSFQRIQIGEHSSQLSYKYEKGLPQFKYSIITSFYKSESGIAQNITAGSGLDYLHKENLFAEFNREPLIPHMLSTEGPALAVGDLNRDGLDDVFIGSSKGYKSGIYMQDNSGKFLKQKIPALDNDSTYEDVDACFIDINNDGNTDIVVSSGGNEYYGHSKFLLPRVYMNDGRGSFYKNEDAFRDIYITQSCIVPYDFNGDGFVDLFIGGRDVPWDYGQTPPSYLMLNDGRGNFRDVTQQYAKELSTVGLVTNAVWFDIDKDGDKDLIVSLEWGGIVAFMNEKGNFKQKILTDKMGWWNFILPCDVDNDGDIDLIAGNLGLNSRLKASEEKPIRLYYNDFDNNGKAEQILTYYLKDKEIPFATKAELEKQIPNLKKRFLYAGDFAKASLEDLLTSDKLESSKILTANYLSNSILLNKGNLEYDVEALPWEAQLTSYRDAIPIDINKDGLTDILLAGNFYENNIEMGRNDADFGTILINKGAGQFAPELINGVPIKGQTRHIRKILLTKEKKEAYIFARNNDSTLLIKFNNSEDKK